MPSSINKKTFHQMEDEIAKEYDGELLGSSNHRHSHPLRSENSIGSTEEARHFNQKHTEAIKTVLDNYYAKNK